MRYKENSPEYLAYVEKQRTRIPPHREILAGRLAGLREERGLKQYEISEILNTNKSYVSNWECGTSTPSIDNLVKLCKFYRVSADWLLGFTEERSLEHD